MSDAELRNRLKQMSRDEQEKRLNELNEKLGLIAPTPLTHDQFQPIRNATELVEREILKELLGY